MRIGCIAKLLGAACGAGVLLGVLESCTGIPALPIDGFQRKYPPSSFVNWETPHVSPLALSPDRATLAAVNTPAASVELFDVSTLPPRPIASIPVGLDPVSVRFRTDDQLWVVNQISDSVSVIGLAGRNVQRTLLTDDEPADVVFSRGKAFVTCAQANTLLVFDLLDLDAAPQRVGLKGENPRALTVSPDGGTIYAAIFESGNHTSLVPWESVSDADGPYQGVNPPPNKGITFDPPLNPDLPLPPPVSMIVRKDAQTGGWLDELGNDWRDYIYWDQHDHDLAAIDADTLEVRYVTRLMNANMQLAALSDGTVVVVGTDATNVTRYEPNLTGKFVHSMMAVVESPATATGATRVADLNPHLAPAYAAGLSSVAPDLRQRSIADPRGVCFLSDRSRGFVTGMGSDNVVAIDATGARLAEAAVPAGPTGLALDEGRGLLYVLSKFDSKLSVLDVSSLASLAVVPIFDPTPAAIRAGRPFLYDAHRTSGLGVTACAACHIDSRMDQLAWDLGNPAGQMKAFDQTCNRPVLDFPVGPCEDFHPMKGPMTTQTLQNIIGTEPFHWRGDRAGIEEFNPAFVGLLGGDRQLTDDELAAFKGLLANIVFPPNPNRNLDGSLRDWVGDGRPNKGETIYFNQGIDLAIAKCNDCHDAKERGAGTNHAITPRNLLINPNQSIDVPQIRNMYTKANFSRDSLENNLGFGYNHDGVFDGLINFFHIPNFTGFTDGKLGEQQRRDVIAYVMSFSTDTHAGSGAQLTLDGRGLDASGARARFALLLKIANQGEVGLIAKGRIDGAARGFVYDGAGSFEPDRSSEPAIRAADLAALARDGGELTLTLVPLGTETRLGVDRDDDGVLDGDEAP
ncbi:MAG: c-type cytochrome [Planctomycetes bacterium]|nr:c-type cytochrome [Planctomycetota bacterium]